MKIVNRLPSKYELFYVRRRWTYQAVVRALVVVALVLVVGYLVVVYVI